MHGKFPDAAHLRWLGKFRMTPLMTYIAADGCGVDYMTSWRHRVEEPKDERGRTPKAVLELMEPEFERA